MFNFSIGRAALAAICAIGLGAPAVSAETLNLRVSTGFPSVHDTTTKLMLPWIDELSARSGVEIKAQLYAAGSSLGALDRQLDQVQKGLVDAAVGLAVVPRGRMPRTELGDIPFLGSDSRAVNEGLSSLIDTDLAPDFKGLKLVNVVMDCAVIHTVNTPVKTLDDMKGLRIRVPSALGAETVKAVGAIPVTMPQSEIYESLQRNVIDGAISPWDIISSLKLGEVLNHHTDNILFCGQLWFAFNERKYNAFPDAVKAAFDEIDGEYALNMAQNVYDEGRNAAKEFAREHGNEFHKLSDADIAEWKARMQPAVDAYLAEYEKSRVPNIREIKAHLDEAIAKAEAN